WITQQRTRLPLQPAHHGAAHPFHVDRRPRPAYRSDQKASPGALYLLDSNCVRSIISKSARFAMYPGLAGFLMPCLTGRAALLFPWARNRQNSPSISALTGNAWTVAHFFSAVMVS